MLSSATLDTFISLQTGGKLAFSSCRAGHDPKGRGFGWGAGLEEGSHLRSQARDKGARGGGGEEEKGRRGEERGMGGKGS